jgi:Fe-S-cluster containining protein
MVMTAENDTLGCRRCGTCCRKGGPALHLQDRELVVQGVIHTRHLYTLRRGEPALDPVREELIRVDGDIIKIKGRAAAAVCRFFDVGLNACGIYAQRPLECRELACWDTQRLEAAYTRGRLTRADLLAGVEGLWEVIEDHGRRCDYERIRGMMDRAGSPAGGAAARRELGELERYDVEIRNLLAARGGIEPEMLDFLLGRPLRTTLPLLRRAVAAENRGRG